MDERAPSQRVGRYAIFDVIAAGGMAQVHIGRLLGPIGFSRTVAIKRMHAQLLTDAEFVAMFVDEARLAARIHHPNVVSTLDVLAEDGEVFVVMEYVRGESLARLVKASDGPIPVRISVAIAIALLSGLHAAHEAKGEDGKPLEIVHRDVSPQNVIVDIDGVVRVLDFGVAKGASRMHSTKDGQIKGKEAYMAPEQVRAAPLDRRVDVFASGIVLWEMLTGRRLFLGDNPAQTLMSVIEAEVPAPSTIVPDVPRALDEVVLRALARDPNERFATTREMSIALEACVTPASVRELSAWVEKFGGEGIARRAARIEEIERSAVTDANELEAGQRPSQGATFVGRRGGAPDPADALTRSPPTIASAPRRSNVPRYAAVGSALAILLVVIVAISRARARDVTSEHVAFSPAASSPALREVTPIIVPPSPSAPPVPTPSAIVSAASPSHVSSPTTRKPSAHNTLAPPKPPSTNCSPPYTIDELGVKHFKPECI